VAPEHRSEGKQDARSFVTLPSLLLGVQDVSLSHFPSQGLHLPVRVSHFPSSRGFALLRGKTGEMTEVILP